LNARNDDEHDSQWWKVGFKGLDIVKALCKGTDAELRVISKRGKGTVVMFRMKTWLLESADEKFNDS